VETGEIRGRLERAARLHWSVSPYDADESFWQEVEQQLIEPAAEALAEEGVPEEKVAGAEAKLLFVLDQVARVAETEAGFPDVGARREFGYREAVQAIPTVMDSLCPIWPFC
jgi:hypothetical protein